LPRLAELIANVVGFKGRFIFDPSKPDETPRKLSRRLKLSALRWRPHIGLESGIRQACDWYRASLDKQTA
jgi:nucleoside-diphosphate-sugar epimerase